MARFSIMGILALASIFYVSGAQDDADEKVSPRRNLREGRDLRLYGYHVRASYSYVPPPLELPTTPPTAAPTPAPTAAPTAAPLDPPTLAPLDPPTFAPTKADVPTIPPADTPTASPPVDDAPTPVPVPPTSGYY